MCINIYLHIYMQNYLHTHVYSSSCLYRFSAHIHIFAYAYNRISIHPIVPVCMHTCTIKSSKNTGLYMNIYTYFYVCIYVNKYNISTSIYMMYSYKLINYFNNVPTYSCQLIHSCTPTNVHIYKNI